MRDIVRKVTYFSMDVPNRPGEGACVLEGLARAGVNLMAFSGFPSGRKAQLDFIPKDPALFKKKVRAAKIKVRPQKSCFLVQGADRKGAVADLLKELSQKKINVTAIDAVSAGAGRYAAILWVQPKDVNKAAKVLRAS